MLSTCAYCGRIHDKKMICPNKELAERKRHRRKKKWSEKDEFRGSNIWKKKRTQIKERDAYVCQTCLHGLEEGKGKRITRDYLEVHHIIPLEEDSTKELEDDWLITLCKNGHELAEKGVISREKLHEIAVQNGK